jgi:hypothetical protein
VQTVGDYNAYGYPWYGYAGYDYPWYIWSRPGFVTGGVFAFGPGHDFHHFHHFRHFLRGSHESFHGGFPSGFRGGGHSHR